MNLKHNAVTTTERTLLAKALVKWRHVSKKHWTCRTIIFHISFFPGGYPILCEWNRKKHTVSVHYSSEKILTWEINPNK